MCVYVSVCVCRLLSLTSENIPILLFNSFLSPYPQSVWKQNEKAKQGKEWGENMFNYSLSRPFLHIFSVYIFWDTLNKRAFNTKFSLVFIYSVVAL